MSRHHFQSLEDTTLDDYHRSLRKYNEEITKLNNGKQMLIFEARRKFKLCDICLKHETFTPILTGLYCEECTKEKNLSNKTFCD